MYLTSTELCFVSLPAFPRYEKINLIAPDKLVAHRGDPFHFPENTLIGMNSAAQAGAVWGEIDVQYTADFTPVLYHDGDLKRVSGDPREISSTTWQELKQLSANHSERFGTKFDSTTVSKFTELLKTLADWPKLRIFVELKTTSINHFGVDRVVGDIVKKISDANCRNQVAAIISKHDVATEAVRALSDIPIGWVVPDFSEANQRRAAQLNFDYLFIRDKRLDDWQHGLPRQSERRVVYTINDMETAKHLLDAGADMIETDLVAELMGRVE